MANNLPIKASTQDHLDIDDIVDDLVLLRGGGVALILQATALNFGLLSELEQDAIIYAYAALLNSLTFPIEIVIRSKRSDISEYLEKISQALAAQTNQDLRSQIAKYKEFIISTVMKNEVLEKKFYLIIPFSLYQLGARGTLVGFSKKQKGAVYSKKYMLEQGKNELIPKRDHLLKQLARIGLTARQLTNHELIELFYDIYNPTEVGQQKITEEAGSYTTPIIQPSIEGQTPIQKTVVGSGYQQLVNQNPPSSPNSQNLNTQLAQNVGVLPESATRPVTNQTEALAQLQATVAKADKLLKQSNSVTGTEEGQPK